MRTILPTVRSAALLSICSMRVEHCDLDDVFIIGGEQIYSEFLPYCDKAYVTKIDAVFPADKYFVNLDKDPNWKLVYESEPITEKGFTYRFTEYERIFNK